jgi:hypothetical protein
MFRRTIMNTKSVLNPIRMATLAGAVVMALASAGVANATPISAGSNNPLAFTWDYNTGTSHLTGFGTLTVSGFNSSSLTVDVTLNNTSLLGGQGGERLTAFAFGIEPNATTAGFVDAPDAGMIDAALGANFPSVQTVEVCAFGGPNCAGGGNGGIFGGSSDTFAVLLGGMWGSSVDIAPIAFKYQTGYGSFEFTSSSSGGTPGNGGTPGTGTVPEPGMVSLLGIGLLGQVWLLRQRRRRQQGK